MLLLYKKGSYLVLQTLLSKLWEYWSMKVMENRDNSKTMKEIENKVDTMINMYRLKLYDTAMRNGYTDPETVACSQELDKWILLGQK